MYEFPCCSSALHSLGGSLCLPMSLPGLDMVLLRHACSQHACPVAVSSRTLPPPATAVAAGQGLATSAPAGRPQVAQLPDGRHHGSSGIPQTSTSPLVLAVTITITITSRPASQAAALLAGACCGCCGCHTLPGT
jgi:hypothetical protein